MNHRHSNRNAQQDRKGRGKVKGLDKTKNTKHQERKNEVIGARPIVPMNELQKDYLWNLRHCRINLALGYAGTSKTYLPTRVAIEKLLLEEIKRIVIVRPPVPKGRSLGFFSGDPVEKMRNWIMPVLDTLEEFLGVSNVDYMLKTGQILAVPLETIKGRSFKDSFIIIDESEDLTEDEFISCVTRIGKNSTMVFAGDVLQSDIRGDNGLQLGLRLSQEPDLDWGVVNFDRVSDIVRDEEVKKTILALKRLGYQC